MQGMNEARSPGISAGRMTVVSSMNFASPVGSAWAQSSFSILATTSSSRARVTAT